MDDYALSDAERALFKALHRRGIRFLLVGMSGAVLQGAPVATQDLDIWLESLDAARLGEVAQDAGGFWVSGFGLHPPSFGGDGLERIDVVLTAHGLAAFDQEYAGALEREVDGVPVRVLPLERIIASKKAVGRAKDQAGLPALEATLKARDDQE